MNNTHIQKIYWIYEARKTIRLRTKKKYYIMPTLTKKFNVWNRVCVEF